MKFIGKGAVHVLGKLEGFVTDKLLTSHFVKHAAEFGERFKNKEEYLKAAQEFFQKEEKGIIGYRRENGDFVRYDFNQNESVVATGEGKIRTYFKPKDGGTYFINQIEKDYGKPIADALRSLFKKEVMYICPVCGYDNLLEPPYDQFGYPSYEICSCCGYEFGFTDSSEKKDFEEYRTEWVNSGFNFFLKSDQPVKWDREKLLKQLKNIEKVNYQARL